MTQMLVVHLATGHVLGAITAGRHVPSVVQAAGGSHVAVRIANDRIVRVPAELLTGLVARADKDVLTRPTHYQVTDATPPVSWNGKPKMLEPVPSKPGREALSIWDGGKEPEIARQSLDNTGALPSNAGPPGATHRLVAVAGEPLMYEP
jgi:hypothetical protein